MKSPWFPLAICLIAFLAAPVVSLAQTMTLEKQLIAEGAASLAKAAMKDGDAKRGAITFYQKQFSCRQCHHPGADGKLIGPELTKKNEPDTAEYLIDSVLQPSKAIRKGFQTATVYTVNGKTISGLVVSESDKGIVLRLATDNYKEFLVKEDDIDEVVPQKLSLMPAGLTNQLASRQQFLDLARYLIEIREGGPGRAADLEPAPHLYAARPLPEYEKRIDHAGMIRSLDNAAYKRGEDIYKRVCINCHGTHDKPGSLPTSLRFASGKFKNGSDPHSMYNTVTKGFGLMVGQAWMVPQQKYDVIHYIRESYVKDRNPSQYTKVDDSYLASLPPGDTRGPAPSNLREWVVMDYGRSLINTYEIRGGGKLNFAYKGIAARLDAGGGGVSRGTHWMVFDHDTLRMAAAWSGKGFIDWNGIHFDGRHNAHPHVVGEVAAQTTGPGWGNPETGSFEDPRFVGRDKRLYGPLPRKWAHYRGLYQYGQKTVIAYTVGETDVLEMPGMSEAVFKTGEETPSPIYTRSFEIGPRNKPMLLRVADGNESAKLTLLDGSEAEQSVAAFGPSLADVRAEAPAPAQVPASAIAQATASIKFNGGTRLEVAKSDDFNMTSQDFTVLASIKTSQNGTIFAKTKPNAEWIRDGKALFIRGGRLCYDIGWVGMVSTRTRVDDNKPHNVALVWRAKTGAVEFYVDGKLDGRGTLRPEGKVSGHQVRIGYAAPDFPKPSGFNGDITSVSFIQRALSAEEVGSVAKKQMASEKLKGAVAHWQPSASKHGKDGVGDLTRKGHTANVIAGPVRLVAATAPTKVDDSVALLAGLSSPVEGVKWEAKNGSLVLSIPAGKKPLKFSLWLTRAAKEADPIALAEEISLPDAPSLSAMTKGGPRQWPEVLTTTGTTQDNGGPFAVDVLARPAVNPWLARLRFTGVEFLPDGDSMLVCAWDGDVWKVTGISDPKLQLKWKRIATGLFQPLGIKLIQGKIFVTCRDQIAILHDLNGDEEIDYFENFNNDHQVTEHFHEFAMGLQTDDEGNLYYAKSARHAKPALVPHHGTLLKVTADGKKTEILATGFRAANGVCLNPDGSFFVTDQEGHWTPKNRINWVTKGGFYGNMLGYHNITDTSNEAMSPPVVWITNGKDRSPAELLWVKSKSWGPLNGKLLNLSYGYGKIFVVPHEIVDGKMQGGVIELPLPSFPTGLVRGRFNPRDGHLYTCGMFAWAGSARQPGGLYRVRATGKPVHVPVGLQAKRNTLMIEFSQPLDAEAASQLGSYRVKSWDLRRAGNYGSKHYNEKTLAVKDAVLSPDGKTVTLTVPDVAPTWCMSINYQLKGTAGQTVRGEIHNTIHALGKTPSAE